MPLIRHINTAARCLDRREKRLLVLSGCAGNIYAIIQNLHQIYPWNDSKSTLPQSWFMCFCQTIFPKNVLLVVFKGFCKAWMEFSESGGELGQEEAVKFNCFGQWIQLLPSSSVMKIMFCFKVLNPACVRLSSSFNHKGHNFPVDYKNTFVCY